MKRISQNKFASSLFSCLGVAACVAFSSCGKKDNDKCESADEHAVSLQDQDQEDNVSIDDDDSTKFENDKLETDSKKNFQFTEAIKKQIAGEDLNNEDEELHDPEQQKPEQPNQGQPDQKQSDSSIKQPKPVQTITEQSNTQQTNSNQSQQIPSQSSQSNAQQTTPNTPYAQSISDESKKLSELVSKESGKHAGVKIGEQYFDLNVFFDLYSWIYKKATTKEGLVQPDELTWENVKKIINNSGFKFDKDQPSNEEKIFGISENVRTGWNEEKKIYPYEFTASNDNAQNLECPGYNGLLKFWAQKNNLGFSEDSFDGGKLKEHANLNQANDVATKLAEYLTKQ